MASTKYEEVKDVLIEALRSGMPKTKAAELCGISRSILYEWISRGENGDTEYVDISDTIKKAQADFVKEALSKIKEAGDNKQWQAYAWLLERMFRREFGRLDKVALTDPGGENEYTGFGEDDERRVEKLHSWLAKYREDGAVGNNGHT